MIVILLIIVVCCLLFAVWWSENKRWFKRNSRSYCNIRIDRNVYE